MMFKRMVVVGERDNKNGKFFDRKMPCDTEIGTVEIGKKCTNCCPCRLVYRR